MDEARGVAVGPPFPQQGAQLGMGAGPFLDQRAPNRGERFGVHARDLSRVGRVDAQLAVEHGLHQRAEGQAVASDHEVHRAAHERGTDDLPVGDQARELVLAEVLEPGPQPEGWGSGRWSRQAGQPFDRVERRQAPAPQEHLSGEQRPVQCARAERAT